jgi:hypothetical protein
VARVFDPGSAFARPREIIDLVARNEGPYLSRYATFQFGVPDANDNTHFVILYEMAGRRHTMDGWLTDDDRVILEERKPELASLTP